MNQTNIRGIDLVHLRLAYKTHPIVGVSRFMDMEV